MPTSPESFKPSSINTDENRRIWRGEGQNRYRVNERKEDPLLEGREVVVQLPDEDKTESGWVIKGFTDKGMFVTLEKNGQTLEVTINELEKLNPPK